MTGDTHVVGCEFPAEIVFHEFFEENPDHHDVRYNTPYGMYSPHCGLENVYLTWGHDEYMYRVAKKYSTLPREALWMIRFHSFYPCHRGGAYQHLMTAEDHEMMKWVKEFNKFDLYSKSDEMPDVEKLKGYYQGLIAKFFPPTIEW